MYPVLSILDSKWQLFVRVAQLGSLSKTATVMDIPQSMVSRHINQLETECGARLFRRTGRGVVLTEFGEQLFPRITALISQSEVIADDIRTTGGLPSGEVRVGLLPSTVPLMAGELFSATQTRMPRVRLHLTEGSSTQLEEQLDDGRLDIALLLREGDSPDRDQPVLVRLHLHLVGPLDSSLLQSSHVDFKQLSGLPLILPSPPHPLRARLEHLAREHRVELNMAIEADSIRLQHAIAAAGGGYAITAALPEPSGAKDLATVPIRNPELLRLIVLGTSLRRPHTLATRQMHDLVEQLASSMLNASEAR